MASTTAGFVIFSLSLILMIQFSIEYDPSNDNIYYLFTRSFPTVGKELWQGHDGQLGRSGFSQKRRTVVLVHGWKNSLRVGDFVNVMINAFLRSDDLNVIVIDWSAGARTSNFFAARRNAVNSAQDAADTLNWLNRVTDYKADKYHIVGHGLGAHQAGIIGRNMNGDVAYITALDPTAQGSTSQGDTLKVKDAQYTEVIHTSIAKFGTRTSLGHVDFYPNGGKNMPGCTEGFCDHERSYKYFAESLQDGGFNSKRCISVYNATLGFCSLTGGLAMGGLTPKTGQSGIFYLTTHAVPPYSKG